MSSPLEEIVPTSKVGPNESMFLRLKEQPGYADLRVRNAEQIERQKHIYFAGKSSASLTQ